MIESGVGLQSWKGRWFSLLCVWFAMPVLLLFYGAQTNLIMLATGVTLVLLAIVPGLRNVRLSGPEMFCAASAALLLIVAQLGSLSPESSFPATWVLALLPLGYLLGKSLGQTLQLAWQGILLILLLIVAFSLWNLVAYGERPSLPLTDSNNCAALMYIAALPVASHAVAANLLRDRRPAGAFALLIIFVLALVIAATGSRAGLMVLAAGGAFLIAIATRLPSKWIEVAGVLAAGAAGVSCFELLLDVSDASAPGAETLTGGIDIRLVLIEAAWSMRDLNPVSGIGPFLFAMFYRQMRGPEDLETAGLFVHNDYVQLVVEVGPLILIPCISLIWIVARSLLNTVFVRLEPGDAERPADVPDIGSAGYALALGGLLAHAVVNFVFYSAVLALLAGLLAARVIQRHDAGAAHSAPARLLLAPGAVVSIIALAYLWVDVATATILQGQPGPRFLSQFAAEPTRQLRYAYLAQDLNPERGSPFLAAAMITTQSAGGADPATSARTLQIWRQALAADPWNTHGIWLFREFVLMHPDVWSLLREEEQAPALTDRMLKLDPVFVPAIEARLVEIAASDASHASTLQAGFLDDHLNDRLLWMAREDREAALAYARFLAAQSPAPERREHWARVGKEIEALKPYIEKRMLF